jgi:hypothetical protein
MNPKADVDTAGASASIEAVRRTVNIAQCECVCTLHTSVCLLTDIGERAGIQPFLYEQGPAS